MISSINPSKHWWDFPAAFLLIAALLTAATRLVSTQWTLDLTLVQNLVLLGGIAGLALGQSRFSSRLVVCFSLAYGLFAVLWQLGLTIQGELHWLDRLQLLWLRITLVIDQLAHGQQVTDSVLFLALIAACFWTLSVLAGYTLTHHGNAWLAILPIGIALFIIHTFDSIIQRYSYYLAFFIFFGLVLVARMAYLQQHNHWKESRTALPPHLGLDFMRYTLAFAVIIVLFSWTVPALANAIPAAAEAIQPVRHSWEKLKDRWENAFASLQSSVGIVHNFYSDTIYLGRGSNLSDDPVIMIKPPANRSVDVPYYWRAQVYDDYQDGRWRNTIYAPRPYNPEGELLSFPEEQSEWIDTFEFIPQASLAAIYTPQLPIWVSQSGQVNLIENPDQTVDLAGFQARPSLRPQQVYQVQGAVKNPAVKELQLAGTDYPEWVAARYLKLPSSITLRTRELAQEITQGLDNPYDKVVAVTTYLRNHIQYQATIPSVPRNQEPIDWLLFDLKKGFCNYYATAEVVLLRTLGIPARWVIGYAQGEILGEGVYLAREADGHAWPEVYFPGIGWVEFEPTASQPEISRPSGEQALIADESTPLEEESMAELRSEQFDALKKQREDFLSSNVANYPRPWQIIIYWGLATSLFILLLVLAWRLLGRLNLPPLPILLERWMVRVGVPPPKVIHDWARRAGLVPIARAYNEINHALARLGDPPRINLTPAERADHLTSLLPPTEKPAKILVQEYQASLFSQSPADLVLARAAGSEIRMLSYHELLQRLLKRLQRPQRHR